MVINWSEVQARLSGEGRGGIYRIARDTGIAYSNVWRIANRRTLRPRIDTIEKIAGYYAQRDSEARAAA